MKYLLLTSMIAFSSYGFSSTYLEDQKIITNNAIDSAISIIEGERPCVEKAKTVESLKMCRVKLSEEMSTMRESIVDTRAEINKYYRTKASSNY